MSSMLTIFTQIYNIVATHTQDLLADDILAISITT